MALKQCVFESVGFANIVVVPCTGSPTLSVQVVLEAAMPSGG